MTLLKQIEYWKRNGNFNFELYLAVCKAKEYVEFKEWWLKEAKEHLRYSKPHLLKAWGWFDLSYGLKVPLQGYE